MQQNKLMVCGFALLSFFTDLDNFISATRPRTHPKKKNKKKNRSNPENQQKLEESNHAAWHKKQKTTLFGDPTFHQLGGLKNIAIFSGF